MIKRPLSHLKNVRQLLAQSYIWILILAIAGLWSHIITQKRIAEFEQSVQSLQNSELQAQIQSISQKVDELNSRLAASVKQNADTAKQGSGVSQIRNNLSEPQSIEEINASRRKQYLMKIKLNKFAQEKNRYPETMEELQNTLGTVPEEDISRSQRISFDKDNRGGWFYDMHKGEIKPNVQ